jgi:para-nitrobenzyl esterase
MIKKAKVENGMLKGIPGADPRVMVYRGVPFAAPPVGDLRWRAPQPAKDWDGELEAYTFAPISMQRKPGLSQTDIYTKEWNPDPEIPMSEDCLYLNIWTPAKTDGEKLPVYVWYFGGGLQCGNTAEMEFNGERIARRGIVVVTVNYRVNAFGFLAHPELTAEDPEFPANFGNLDQKFGTEWVKRNIRAFGGDPDNITIGGQSAGGGSVLTQLTSPLTKGLFQKAIVQSGSMLGGYDNRFFRGLPLAEAEKEGEEFFAYLGVKTLAEARALDAEFIRDKVLTYDKWFGTVADGNYVVGNAMELLHKNKRHMVPLLMGYTSSEFHSSPTVSSFEELEKLATEKFGDKAPEFLALCKSDDLQEAIQKATFSPIELGIRTIYKSTEKATNPPANYFYEFDAFIPGEDNPGTFHSVDLWFFFETLAACWRPFTGVHYDLARQMCNYWANFIRSGNPNGVDADGTPMPHWKPFSEGECPMIFTDKPQMSKEAPTALMSFLEDFYLGK